MTTDSAELAKAIRGLARRAFDLVKQTDELLGEIALISHAVDDSPLQPTELAAWIRNLPEAIQRRVAAGPK